MGADRLAISNKKATKKLKFSKYITKNFSGIVKVILAYFTLSLTSEKHVRISWLKFYS